MTAEAHCLPRSVRSGTLSTPMWEHLHPFAPGTSLTAETAFSLSLSLSLSQSLSVSFSLSLSLSLSVSLSLTFAQDCTTGLLPLVVALQCAVPNEALLLTLLQPTFDSVALSPNAKVSAEEEEAKPKDDGDKETEEPKETEETEEKGPGGPSPPTPPHPIPFTRLLTHAAHHSLPAFTTALLTAGADPALKAHIPLCVCVRECLVLVLPLRVEA